MPENDESMKRCSLDHINENTLYPYQKSIIASGLIQNRNARVIDCIYDIKGNRGKSTVSNYIDIHNLGYAMPTINSFSKITQSVCDILIHKQDRDPNILLFDIPRAANADKHKSLSELRTAFEQIKRGKVYDVRHSYKEWRFDSPRIWIFTNDIIDKSLLSSDKWKIWIINDDNELEPYIRPTNLFVESDSE
jgi:hypothetical protein